MQSRGSNERNNYHLLLNHDTFHSILIHLNDSISQTSIRLSCRYFCSIVPKPKMILPDFANGIWKQWSSVLRLVRQIKLKNMNDCSVTISVNKPLIEIDYNFASDFEIFLNDATGPNCVLSFNYVTGWIIFNDVHKIAHIQQNFDDLLKLFTQKKLINCHFVLHNKLNESDISFLSLMHASRSVFAFQYKYSIVSRTEYVEATAQKIIKSFRWITLRIHETIPPDSKNTRRTKIKRFSIKS